MLAVKNTYFSKEKHLDTPILRLSSTKLMVSALSSPHATSLIGQPYLPPLSTELLDQPYSDDISGSLTVTAYTT